MDVLVVVGAAEPPQRLLQRALHVVWVSPGLVPRDIVADLRSRIPREVGVTGSQPEAAAVAFELAGHGFPVSLRLQDTPSDVSRYERAGIRIVPADDVSAGREVADSLMDLVGNTPLVRLDRTARDLDCTLLAKAEML
ncbi:MAG: hypothetical protein ABR548_08995, partial [Actinomycetota bacterium]